MEQIKPQSNKDGEMIITKILFGITILLHCLFVLYVVSPPVSNILGILTDNVWIHDRLTRGVMFLFVLPLIFLLSVPVSVISFRVLVKAGKISLQQHRYIFVMFLVSILMPFFIMFLPFLITALGL